ncbi:MAG: DUF642 domain-containing protein [Planctomycetes bacterium]|nr:DUF642 domain-containing protein [Planctomycetota bacterium]
MGRSVWYAAALITLAAALYFVLLPSTPHSPLPAPHSAAPASFAVLSDLSDDAQFDNTDGSLPLGSDLAGPIKLTAGRAQLMFKSTAVVDLTGPCEFEMTGPNRGRLTSGKLEAYCRPEAHGFTIDLPGGVRVVDLGTRFDLVMHAEGDGRITVREGRVEVRLPTNPTAARLEAGQTGRLTMTQGVAGLSEIGPANFVVNGGFEDAATIDQPGALGLWNLALSNTRPAGQLSTISGWTVAGCGRWLMGPDYFQPSEGQRCLNLTNYPGQSMAIEQAVRVVPDQRYVLRLDLAGRFDSPRRSSSQSIHVQMSDDAGALVDRTLSVARPEGFDRVTRPGWQPQSISFRARSERMILHLQTAAGSDDFGVVVDNIRVEQASDNDELVTSPVSSTPPTLIATPKLEK